VIGAVSRAFDRFRGSGDAAVTIPSLDGAFRPNNRLEGAAAALEIAAPDNIAYDGQRLLFSSGSALFAFRAAASSSFERIADYEQTITAIDAGAGGLTAIGLATGEVLLVKDGVVERRFKTVQNSPMHCPTALRFVNVETLLACLGSAQNDPTEWARDLLEGNSSGSVWRIDIASGKADCLADNLAWPNGVVVLSDGRTVVAEAWRHQLVDITHGRPQPLLTEIPGYPARISAAAGGGYWLSIFAPRSQLVEFVLREPRYRERMMREVDQRFWVAPSLHAARDYREPLQAGAIKQLGELKPWAPSRSYGLIARLGAEFEPIESFHSRADGRRHGITSSVESDGQLHITSKGGNMILALDLAGSKEP
jgi:Strictosidine synthase